MRPWDNYFFYQQLSLSELDARKWSFIHQQLLCSACDLLVIIFNGDHRDFCACFCIKPNENSVIHFFCIWIHLCKRWNKVYDNFSRSEFLFLFLMTPSFSLMIWELGHLMSLHNNRKAVKDWQFFNWELSCTGMLYCTVASEWPVCRHSFPTLPRGGGVDRQLTVQLTKKDLY